MTRFLLRLALTAATVLLTSVTALSCPVGRDWQDFTSISFTPANGSIEFTRYSNGTHVIMRREGQRIEAYTLANGLNLYKGYDPRKEESPFFINEIPSDDIIAFLSHTFRTPCEVTRKAVSLQYREPRDGMTVKGKARAVLDNIITYELTLQAPDSRDTLALNGSISFAEPTAIPDNMPLAGWTISRGTGFGANAIIITPTADIKTIGDLLFKYPRR